MNVHLRRGLLGLFIASRPALAEAPEPAAPTSDRGCGALVAPTTLAPLTSAVPALLRLPAAGLPAGASVGFVGIAANGSVCVEVAPGVHARVSAAAVGILPFTAPILASPAAAAALVLEADGTNIRVDRGGVFQPEPDRQLVAPGALDLRVAAAPLVLGDLPLAALVLGRTPPGDLAAEVRTPVAIRGLLLPPGAEIQVGGFNGILSNVVLRKAAKVGGLSGKVGDRLELVNGCDFAHVPAGSSGVEQHVCYDVRDGVLIAPG